MVDALPQRGAKIIVVGSLTKIVTLPKMAVVLQQYAIVAGRVPDVTKMGIRHINNSQIKTYVQQKGGKNVANSALQRNTTTINQA